jgi:predicted Mrr-cat superfamily restriction endonuclease
MSLWLVRAGRHGEQEETALKEGVVTIVGVVGFHLVSLSVG